MKSPRTEPVVSSGYGGFHPPKQKERPHSSTGKTRGFLRRWINKQQKTNTLDLSSDEDLSIAIMNLVSIEEYFSSTGTKTSWQYYDLLSKIREIRNELLGKIVKDVEGEGFCISKHLLAVSMRLIEAGSKSLSQDKKQEAEGFFSKAYGLYSLFWGVNLKLIDINDVRKNSEKHLTKRDKDETKLTKRLNKLVQELIDCCQE